ncbi:hypothetical protein QTP88_025638 [Uroleucon formosanum]
MTIENRFLKNKNIMQALTFFDPNRFIDIKNKILTFDGNNEKVFNNFSEIIGLQIDLINEELINFSASYDMVSKSLEGEIKFNDSEESEVIDEDDNLYKNQTMTDIPKYSPKPNKYKNSTCSKCMPSVMKLLYKYNFHTAAFTNLYLAYKFILTLSCTQVHCERSFSKLKIIKTRLRSSISQELLEPLLLISIESVFNWTLAPRFLFLFFVLISPFAGRPDGKRLLPFVTPGNFLAIDVSWTLIFAPGLFAKPQLNLQQYVKMILPLSFRCYVLQTRL